MIEDTPDEDYPTEVGVLPDGHLAVATSEYGILAFGVIAESVHIHVFTDNGEVECLGRATPEQTDEWIRRLYALRNVAVDRRDTGGDSL